MKKILFAIIYLMCSASISQAADLVVFSGRKEPLIKPVIQLFEESTGIRVILKTGKSTALGQQILQELPNPSADIYIAKESGSLEYLRGKNAFAIYTSESTQKIPAQFKAADGSWIGVSGRSRALIYNTDLIDAKDVPDSLYDLIKPKYKGKIAAVNAGNESFVAWVSALRIALGDEAVKKLLMQLKENDIQLLSSSHTDIRKAVGRGEYPLGLINHYYYHIQKHEIDLSLTNVGIVYLDQNEGERGELVNVSGAAIVRGARHLKEAKIFIDFLISSEAQKLFVDVNFEYPLLRDVATNTEVVKAIGCASGSALECLNIMDVSLDQFGEQMEATLELLDQVDWY